MELWRTVIFKSNVPEEVRNELKNQVLRSLKLTVCDGKVRIDLYTVEQAGWIVYIS